MVDAGNSVRLDDTIVRFVARLPQGNTVQQDCTIKENNIVTVDLKQSFFVQAGIHTCEVQLYNALDQTLRVTFPSFRYYVTNSLMNDETVQGDNNFTILQGMINDVKVSHEVATNAIEMANNAINIVGQTKDQVDLISIVADNAKDKAYESATVAGESLTVANQSKTIADSAMQIATNAESKATEIIANGNYAKEQGDYAKVEGEKLSKKVTLNGLEENSFDFITDGESLTGLKVGENNFNIVGSGGGSDVSTTDEVVDSLGRTQEQVNKILYKGLCKEFVSNGEDIVINNGLDAYLFGAKLEGQTVNNCVNLETLDDWGIPTNQTQYFELLEDGYMKYTSTTSSNISAWIKKNVLM